MSQLHIRLPLHNTDFPLRSSLAGRSVIIPAQDVAISNESNIPAIRPKLVFCQNALPTKEGYRSVSTSSYRTAATPAANPFDKVWEVSSTGGFTGLFSPANGSNYFSSAAIPNWVRPSSLTPINPTLSTHANVAGQSYICYGFGTLHSLNCADGTLNTATPVGITVATQMKGICASGSQLIIYSADTIYWSSVSNPLDFTPSLITGAGSAIPEDLTGVIQAVHPTTEGFNIYTNLEVIKATATGNASYPFIFKVIANAMPPKDASIVQSTNKHSTVYIHTDGGILALSSEGEAAPILPEISDFAHAGIIEDWDGTTLTESGGTSELLCRIAHLVPRYLVVSYGVSSYTHALIYDLALKRWGKLKVTHIAALSISAEASDGVQLLFPQSDGAILKLDYRGTHSNSTVMIGGISLQRDKVHTLLEVACDTTAYLSYAVSENFGIGTKVPLTESLRDNSYFCRSSGRNHTLIMEGTFNLTNLQVTLTQGGNR